MGIVTKAVLLLALCKVIKTSAFVFSLTLFILLVGCCYGLSNLKGASPPNDHENGNRSIAMSKEVVENQDKHATTTSFSTSENADIEWV